jgi:surfeit locus 1 family protein
VDRPRRTFRPPWWATLGTLALGGLFLAAGTWQLSRAAEKRAIFAAFDAGASGGTVPLPPPGAELGALRYRAVRLAGRYDAARQVLLDARTRDGRAGYEVLTPLRADEGPAVLVNRGWIPADPDRTRLPDVAVGDAPREVTGLLDRLPRAAMASAAPAADPAAPWPRRLLFPTAAEIGAALGYPVADYQVLLAPAAPDGYDRAWRPALLTPQQHLGYAVQWFALAAALVVLYAALNWRKPAAGPPEP